MKEVYSLKLFHMCSIKSSISNLSWYDYDTQIKKQSTCPDSFRRNSRQAVEILNTSAESKCDIKTAYSHII